MALRGEMDDGVWTKHVENLTQCAPIANIHTLEIIKRIINDFGHVGEVTRVG
jgi:hypothetical protein